MFLFYQFVETIDGRKLRLPRKYTQEEHIDNISLTIIDTGIGFKDIKTSELTKPYFTTKTDGTGLGLSIVSKIINDHNGVIMFNNITDGAKVEIKFPNNNTYDVLGVLYEKEDSYVSRENMK